ncbi:hypothetical protein [Klenkia taihuensis]|uniref:Uncharacterized protein n=1 Tax=Klenkia taihuensis TaxID=1225127 RepID=A0A1I1HLW5_9ACTN|nr:hypothetical protein [Klenkia taihuensis]GHE09134.1 hypothetical protein GCM10011381_12580 [Klenkia taihuensis]SFC24562.1 hypothetical protein SAMN05661030_0477 [Klenkia taihuensis]
MVREQRPSIFQLGAVEGTGGDTVVSGWGLGMCAGRCACHRDPAGGQLRISEDRVAGTLGLHCFTAAGCGCCRPWRVDELRAVLRDVAAVAALEARERTAG